MRSTQLRPSEMAERVNLRACNLALTESDSQPNRPHIRGRAALFLVSRVGDGIRIRESLLGKRSTADRTTQSSLHR